ncbi:MAG: uracil-DNA glycosylase [Burkholderiales bacterium]|jgi:DNA polymerase|nr:uracil-DNA glycosylase [Burkholderiales bacterium]
MPRLDMTDGQNMHRDELLKEIGISPVWRLRDAPQAEIAVAADTAAALTAREPAAPVVARGGDPGPVAGMDWPALKACVADCTACVLHQKRNKTVFGVGDENADWLFVGEGPGADEDAQGEPFVGQAGRLLDNMLAAIALKRGANVYIANIVKCRPPGNRNPQPEEAEACSGYLQRQIELIQPKLIIALGKVAAVNLLGRDASIASLRGQQHAYRGIPLLVTYHPAYLLRTLSDKSKAWEDLCFAVETMQRLQSAALAPI